MGRAAPASALAFFVASAKSRGRNCEVRVPVSPVAVRFLPGRGHLASLWYMGG